MGGASKGVSYRRGWRSVGQREELLALFDGQGVPALNVVGGVREELSPVIPAAIQQPQPVHEHDECLPDALARSTLARSLRSASRRVP